MKILKQILGVVAILFASTLLFAQNQCFYFPPLVQPNPIDPSFVPSYSYNGPSYVWAVDTSTKIFQNGTYDMSVHVSTPSGIKNELISFQQCVHAPAGGLTALSLSMTNLINAQTGTVISSESITKANNWWVMVETYTYISTPTAVSSGGYIGAYNSEVPFGLIPLRDLYYHQLTSFNSLNVGAGLNQCYWFTILPPTSAPGGFYSGTVNYSTGGYTFANVPVVLELGDWIMASTPTYVSQNGFAYADLCQQQYGGSPLPNSNCHAYRPDVCGNSGSGPDDLCASLIVPHDEAVFALDHRMSNSSINPGSQPMGSIQKYMFDLISGTQPYNSPTGVSPLLVGARLTSVDYDPVTRNVASATQWITTFTASGVRTSPFIPLGYACDEPSGAAQWVACFNYINSVYGSSLPILVTTDINTAGLEGATTALTIIVPTVEALYQSRASYNPFLALSSSNSILSYNDCLSEQGGSGGCLGAANILAGQKGGGSFNPNHHIDGTAIANRAMPYVVFSSTISGSLNSIFTNCWFKSNQCGNVSSSNVWAVNGLLFDGWGDETWTLPGITSIIGVSTPIVLSSFPLEQETLGIQDYEYMHTLVVFGQSNAVWTDLNTWYIDSRNYNMQPHSASFPYTGTVSSAHQDMLCRINDLNHPGGKCAW